MATESLMPLQSPNHSYHVTGKEEVWEVQPLLRVCHSLVEEDPASDCWCPGASVIPGSFFWHKFNLAVYQSTCVSGYVILQENLLKPCSLCLVPPICLENIFLLLGWFEKFFFHFSLIFCFISLSFSQTSESPHSSETFSPCWQVL